MRPIAAKGDSAYDIIAMRVRLVLDTCVIVAAIRSHSGASRVVVDVASTDTITVLSDALVSQYEEVIFRPENRVPA